MAHPFRNSIEIVSTYALLNKTKKHMEVIREDTIDIGLQFVELLKEHNEMLGFVGSFDEDAVKAQFAELLKEHNEMIGCVNDAMTSLNTLPVTAGDPKRVTVVENVNIPMKAAV